MRVNRQIASTPEKILDAPDMINDFYLHLMDWSSLNHMAVALSAGVYIWNATDGTILQLCQREVDEEYVSSVSWIKVSTPPPPFLGTVNRTLKIDVLFYFNLTNSCIIRL